MTKITATVKKFLKTVAAEQESRTHNKTIGEAFKAGYVYYSEGTRENDHGAWVVRNSGWRLTEFGRKVLGI